jgi:hypothetical protein
MTFALRTLGLLGVALFLSTPARAETPPGRYTVAAGVVTDTATGLKWQQTVAGTLTYAYASTTYCPNFAAGGMNTGWRLPTSKELASLVDYRFRNSGSTAVIDPVAFPSTPLAEFRTSTASKTSHLTVNFQTGGMIPQPDASSFMVRCVHD